MYDDPRSSTSSERKVPKKHNLNFFSVGIICILCLMLILTCLCITTSVIFLRRRASLFFPLLGEFVGSSHHLVGQYSDMAGMDKNFRLSQSVRPLNYDLYLHPDIEKGTFTGKVSILIDVSLNRKHLQLHQKDLNVTVVSLQPHGSQEDDGKVVIEKSYTDNENEIFNIALREEISSGLYNLCLSFEGSLQNKIVGFYSSKYKDEANKTRTIATSKFEPTYARRCFPCFDEPGFKAEFEVKLVHPSGDCYHALSNMNVKDLMVDKPSAGLTTAVFAKTVPMSTYLACFIVSDFVAVTRKANGLNGRTFPISVYTTRTQKEKGSFALDVGVKIIEYYINLFKIDYPLPKLDMAAIPDFVSGAMENWGLVTYREARLLYSNKSTSTENKEAIVGVIGHEFAHMWFGNLVTMAWWNDLWLNEGFATYMTYKSASAIFPEWHLMDHFALQVLHPALNFDAKKSSHPIVQEVNSPDEITAIFDLISYQKGASILRMLERTLGSDTFFTGTTMYLKKFSYGNAETKDFFNMLQKNVKDQVNIQGFMNTWTIQMGFPVVNVAKDGSKYTLTQKRFLSYANAKCNESESKFGYKWTIPITYVTSKNSTPTLIWFDKDASNLTVELNEPVDWIKFNADQVGYYRVNYCASGWETLLNVLLWSHKRFSIQDRTHLLEDGFSLANAEQLDYLIVLNMTLYLGNEKNYPPWYVAASNFKFIDSLLSSTTFLQKFRDYVRELVDGAYHDVTWNPDESEEPETSNLRNTILSLACYVGHAECLEEVGDVFKTWINNEKDVRPHPDIRDLVYYYGMNSVGGEQEWNVMFERFTKENNAAEKVKLMKGLAGIRSNWILKKYINLAMDENYIRSQDALNCLSSISNNPEGRLLVWDWVRENWQLLVTRYTLNDRYLGQLIPAITRKFSTTIKLNEMHSFFEKYPEAGAGASYRVQALETVETNIAWLERNSNQINEWLDSRPTPKHKS
ncbi:glutamyl aminopeptidase [Copidosoma floridanum]|uniref:glutamyl aminopeptidase n=1 Tax=Copidosoma floridanum TaxID=29053 RepID=UPI0006C997DB|nr:glutamyl aminopeptidase [Copidosoma floridanum]